MATVTKPMMLDETGQVIAQALQTIAGTRPDRLNKFAADIAQVESSTTSTHAYSADDYLMLNDQLYKVTDTIAIGDTLTVGTNIEATVLTDEMGGGSAGHTIENSAGTDMTARSNLQFINSTVTDDSTNDRTVVAPNNITTTTTDPGEGSALATNCLLFVIEE